MWFIYQMLQIACLCDADKTHALCIFPRFLQRSRLGDHSQLSVLHIIQYLSFGDRESVNSDVDKYARQIRWFHRNQHVADSV